MSDQTPANDPIHVRAMTAAAALRDSFGDLDLAADLVAVQQESGSRPTDPASRSTRRWVAAAAVLIVAAGTAALFTVPNSGGPSLDAPASTAAPTVESVSSPATTMTPATPATTTSSTPSTTSSTPARASCPIPPAFRATVVPDAFGPELIAGEGGRITIGPDGEVQPIEPVDPDVVHVAGPPGTYIDIIAGAAPGYVATDTEALTVLDSPATLGSIEDGYVARVHMACGTYTFTAYGVSRSDVAAFLLGLQAT